MNELIMLLAGGIFTLVMESLYGFWKRGQEGARKWKALAVLKRHGLVAERYVAAMDIEDAELRGALDELSFAGYIIINQKGEVIGKLCPRVVKGSHLQLVVSSGKFKGRPLPSTPSMQDD
jgi:hypothetical protein